MVHIISTFSIVMAPHLDRINSQESILLCFRLSFLSYFQISVEAKVEIRWH